LRHFSIPGFLRSDALAREEIENLIYNGKYFVLHEQRQSGKTSYLLELRDYLNSKREYAALYINVETAQVNWSDFVRGIGTILDEISEKCKLTFGTDLHVGQYVAHINAEKQLEGALQHLSITLQRQGRKFVLLLDEIDSLHGDTLLSVLRYETMKFLPPPTTITTSLL